MHCVEKKVQSEIHVGHDQQNSHFSQTRPTPFPCITDQQILFFFNLTSFFFFFSTLETCLSHDKSFLHFSKIILLTLLYFYFFKYKYFWFATMFSPPLLPLSPLFNFFPFEKVKKKKIFKLFFVIKAPNSNQI